MAEELTWLVSRDMAWLPRMEARHGDRAQMAGDVLINSMQEVLSPG